MLFMHESIYLSVLREGIIIISYRHKFEAIALIFKVSSPSTVILPNGTTGREYRPSIPISIVIPSPDIINLNMRHNQIHTLRTSTTRKEWIMPRRQRAVLHVVTAIRDIAASRGGHSRGGMNKRWHSRDRVIPTSMHIPVLISKLRQRKMKPGVRGGWMD